MKQLVLFFALILIFFSPTKAQDLNWQQVRNQGDHFVAAKFGADYGTVYGLSYGQRLKSARPTFLALELSAPFGKNALDDWKTRLSIQREIWRQGHFSLGLKPGLVVRRFESEIATLLNSSVDITGALGYYGSKWVFAVEANYDQTIATHVQHHSLQDNYPGIYNGWIGSTGGNFKFGGQVAYSFGKNMASLKLGKAYARNFQDNPTLPFYFELGWVKNW